VAIEEQNIGVGDDDDDEMDHHILKSLQRRLATIIEPYYKNQEPVVVRGAVRTAPATKLWNSWTYWRETFQPCGEVQNSVNPTMVAVEMGGSYGSHQSERAEIPFLAYLQYLELFEQRHGRTGGELQHLSRSSWSSIPSEELVYMAQNDLLEPLYKDIIIPDFCQSNDTENNKNSFASSPPVVGLGRLYSVMIWLGPRGSVSPLHFDPLDNCLMQHVGRKRVLLYEPASSSSIGWHYAGHDGQQNNTSPINPEFLDDDDDDTSATTKVIREQYPLFFDEAPPRRECILLPGDLLYIPAKWWHHVRSIDTSASVNVWWR
jgi:hypothetical protein